MAPVLAIPGMVATGVEYDSSFDPVGEILKPIATGPSLAHFPEEENKDGDRQDESKAEERACAAVAIGEPGAGDSASQSRWDRRRERRPLRGGAAGPRPGAGAPVRMLHTGLASSGGLVGGVWSRDDSDAVHWRI